MSSNSIHARGPTSPAHDFYDVVFQGADIASSYWQPAFKAVGRWQLEVAHLAAKQLRATMALTSDLMHAGSSTAMTTAYQSYWDDLSQCYSEANRNIANALSSTSGQAAIMQMPPRRRRDTLDLIDGVEFEVPDGEPRYERRVA